MLAIVGGKGGCGKTTTALGLARALAQTGDRPLVVDADCDMPNLHALAETDREPGLAAVEDGADIARVVHRSGAYPGVDVLPAGRARTAAGERALTRLARRPRPVVVDCPAGASQGVAAPLRAADAALVVSTAGRESLDDAARTARMVDSLGTRLLGAVVTRVDGDRSTAAGGDRLGADCPVLETVPDVEDEVLASESGRASYERLAARLSRGNTRRNI